MPTRETRALWHPTRARILELIKAAPAHQSYLIEKTAAPRGKVAYHCRALCHSNCIKLASSSSPGADDPLYLVP